MSYSAILWTIWSCVYYLVFCFVCLRQLIQLMTRLPVVPLSLFSLFSWGHCSQWLCTAVFKSIICFLCLMLMSIWSAVLGTPVGGLTVDQRSWGACCVICVGGLAWRRLLRHLCWRFSILHSITLMPPMLALLLIWILSSLHSLVGLIPLNVIWLSRMPHRWGGYYIALHCQLSLIVTSFPCPMIA